MNVIDVKIKRVDNPDIFEEVKSILNFRTNNLNPKCLFGKKVESSLNHMKIYLPFRSGGLIRMSIFSLPVRWI